MKVFERPNLNGFICPICGTAEDKPVVLVEIEGTQKGNIAEARQYHIDCIQLTEYGQPNSNRIAIGMSFDRKGGEEIK